MQQVAVIGAGTIGASWAAYFLSRGLDVTASDPAPGGEAFARPKPSPLALAERYRCMKELAKSEGETKAPSGLWPGP